MQKVIKFLKNYGLELLLLAAGLLLLFLLLWFRLGSLTFGNAAEIEAASRQAAVSWQAIFENPLNAPYKVVQKLVIMTGHDGVTSMRLVSTAWAILAMLLFYIVARGWHSVRVAGLATWLFISSAWFLHTARLATPEILWLVGILALVVLFSPNKNGRQNRLALPSLLITLGLLLYVPGMVWLVALGVILRWRNITEAWEASSHAGLRAASVAGSILVLSPLVLALTRDIGLVRSWAGFAEPLNAPVEMFKQYLNVPVQLFYNGPHDPVHWLGNLPLLSIFETIMFVIGAYFYARHFKSARARFVLALALLAWLVISIGGAVSLSLIVPVVYLIVATGIAYMLHDWFNVFPNNPLARWAGVLVISVAVLLTSIYQTRSYFVAWRYSPDTAKVFTRKL